MLRMDGTAAGSRSQMRMLAPASAAAFSRLVTSCAVMRSASPSSATSAVTSSGAPATRSGRTRLSTSLNRVTSQLPAVSVMVSHAMRLPVLVGRSFMLTMQPASLRRPRPVSARTPT